MSRVLTVENESAHSPHRTAVEAMQRGLVTLWVAPTTDHGVPMPPRAACASHGGVHVLDGDARSLEFAARRAGGLGR